MSVWQTGKLDLKCSIGVIQKALISIMPEWKSHIVTDENGELNAKLHGNIKKQKCHVLVKADSKLKLYSDIGLYRNSIGTWELGGDYSIELLNNQLTSEVMRMKALAIAKLRGHEILRNESNEHESVTDIRVDEDKMMELF